MRLRRPTRVASAAVLASALLLSACTGGGSDPGPTATTTPSTTTATAPITTSPTSPPTTSTTSASGPDFPKGVPAAAQKQTSEGAKAFAAHFIKQLNIAWTTADPEAIEPLCDLKSSSSCRYFIDTARDLKSKGNRYDGNPTSSPNFTNLSTKLGSQQILVSLVQEMRNVVDRAGNVVLTDQRKNLIFVISLAWTNSGWQIQSIKTTSK